MPRSMDRILTTHAESLPMPPDLGAMLRAKEAGQSYDRIERLGYRVHLTPVTTTAA